VIKEFHLTNPVDVIRLYVFCSKLKKYCQDILALELQEWNIPDEKTIKNFTWRSPIRKRSPARTHQTDAGGPTHGSNGDGGSNDGPMDADGFDNDQAMEVEIA